MSNRARKKRVNRGRQKANPINLRSAIGSEVEVDRDSATISGASIITEGPAVGHGFMVDGVMLSQVHDHLSKSARMNVRLTHPDPWMGRDPIECLVGHVENPRLDGDRVRGDIVIDDFAANSPMGNMREYLLSIAESAPDSIGLSISFEPAAFEKTRSKDGEHIALGRVAKLLAVDFVGDPGANRDGLLSSKGPSGPEQLGEISMDDQILADLRVLLGLPDDAPEEDVISVLRAKAIEAGEEPEPDEPEEGAAPDDAPPPADIPAEGMSAATPEQIRLAERNRQKQIRHLGKSLNIGDDWAQAQIDADATIEDARKDALKEIEKLMRKTNVKGANITVGADLNLSTLRPAISDAVLLRAGVITEDKAHKRSAEFRRPLVEIARRWLSSVGANDAETLTNSQIIDRLGPKSFRRHYPTVDLAQSSSDFDNILADAMGKSLRMAYEDQPTKWQEFCRRETASDFKTIKPTALSESPDLTARDEGAGITYVTLSDTRETGKLVEYTAGIKLTRQAIINDDLGAFGRIPKLQAMAAARKEDDLAFGVLTTNAEMSDGVTLFYATTHVNYLASGSGAPSVSTIAGLEKLMLKQKGPKSSARLGIEPSIIIVPAALKVATQQLVGSAVDPAKSNSTPNPYANQLRVVWDARLDEEDAAEWYLAADPNRWDTIAMYFLEGEPAPVLRQETDFDTEDVKFAVRHTIAAFALDYRGLAKSKGTA